MMNEWLHDDRWTNRSVDRCGRLRETLDTDLITKGEPKIRS